MHGHKSENKWLGPCYLYQNYMKNSNLKVYLLYKVPDMFKFNILSNFVALFFLLQIHMTASCHESKTC